MSQYVKDYIRKRLIGRDFHRSDVRIPDTVVFVKPDALMAEISEGRGKLYSYFIKKAFIHRDRIKSIPYIGAKAVAIKNNMQRKKYSVVDCSDIVGFSPEIFIPFLYKKLLAREASEADVNAYTALIYDGMPQGGIVYMIASSPEFANRYRIADISDYKKQYRRYMLKNKLKKIPFFGRIISFLLLPARIELLLQRINQLDARLAVHEQNSAMRDSRMQAVIQRGTDNK